MFLNNYYYGLAANFHAAAPHPTTTLYPNVKNVNGTLPSKLQNMYVWAQGLCLATATTPGSPTLNLCQTSYTSLGGVVFGTGTTAPALDDYCLSGDLITTFAYTVASFTVDADDTGVTITALYTLTNTGDDAFTIGEVGLIASTYDNSNYKSANYKCLLERTVLDTPVTIAAGGVGQVTYTLKMNYPTE